MRLHFTDNTFVVFIFPLEPLNLLTLPVDCTINRILQQLTPNNDSVVVDALCTVGGLNTNSSQ